MFLTPYTQIFMRYYHNILFLIISEIFDRNKKYYSNIN